MINKNCEGRVPTPGPLNAEDEAILKIADEAIDICREEMGKQQIHKAVAAIINIVNEADRYFAAQAPWVLKKTDEARMGTVLYVTADVVRQIAILFQPIMPETSAKILDLVDVAEEDRVFAKLGATGRLTPVRSCRRRRRSIRATSPRTRARRETMLIDTHCHLDFADFDSERDELVTRAHQAGVKQMVTISTRVRKLETLLALTERYPSVFLLGRHASEQCRRRAGCDGGRAGAACGKS